ncbi:MAG: hypothetical protein ACI8RE_000682, partial [Ilumatobacter sp.]
AKQPTERRATENTGSERSVAMSCDPMTAAVVANFHTRQGCFGSRVQSELSPQASKSAAKRPVC